MIVDVIIGGQGAFSQLPEATLTRKGIVMLANAADSGDESNAATPKAVYDAVKTLADKEGLDLETILGGVPTAGNTLNKLYGLIVLLQNLVASDDVNLDTVQEVVTFIKNNKDVIDSISTNKVNISDIVDNLTSADTNKPLSANQGKVLNELVFAKVKTADIVDNLTDASTDKPLSANQGKVLKGLLDTSGLIKIGAIAGGQAETQVAINNCVLSRILIMFTSGSATLKIGTTPGASDVYTGEITEDDDINLSFRAYTATTLYINATGVGVFKLTLKTDNNLF